MGSYKHLGPEITEVLYPLSLLTFLFLNHPILNLVLTDSHHLGVDPNPP